MKERKKAHMIMFYPSDWKKVKKAAKARDISSSEYIRLLINQ